MSGWTWAWGPKGDGCPESFTQALQEDGREPWVRMGRNDLGSAHDFISCLFLRQMNTWFICLNLRCISHINRAMCRILFKKILSVSSTFSPSPFYAGLSSASTSLYLQLQIKKIDNASMMMNDGWHLAWAWSCQQEVEGWWQARTLTSHQSCSSISILAHSCLGRVCFHLTMTFCERSVISVCLY